MSLPPQTLITDLLNTLLDKLTVQCSIHTRTYLPQRKVCLAQQSAAAGDFAVLIVYRAKPLLPGKVGGETDYSSNWHPLDVVLHSSSRRWQECGGYSWG